MATAAATEPTITLTRRYFNELSSKHPRAAAAAKKGAAALRDDNYGLSSIGIGAVAMFVGTTDWAKKNKTFKKYWWLLPALILGLGWWLRRKQDRASARYRYGSALMVAGGGLLVKAWRERPKKKDEGEEEEAKEDTKGPEGVSSFGTSAGRLVLNPATGEYMFEPSTPANYRQPDPAQQMAERLYDTAA